jgi:hypothetical protein
MGVSSRKIQEHFYLFVVVILQLKRYRIHNGFDIQIHPLNFQTVEVEEWMDLQKYLKNRGVSGADSRYLEFDDSRHLEFYDSCYSLPLNEKHVIYKMDNYQINLRTISKIQVGEKITFRHGLIDIYRDSFAIWLWRKITNENKDNMITALENFYRDLLVLVQSKAQFSCRTQLLSEIVSQRSQGVESLITTYGNFPQAKSRLETIKSRYIDIIIKSLNST